MKRFLIFGGQFSQPLGGWQDLKGHAAELTEAVALAQQYEWVHIVDTNQNRIVYAGKNVNGKWVNSVPAKT